MYAALYAALFRLALPLAVVTAAWLHGYHVKNGQVETAQSKREAADVKDARRKEQAAVVKTKDISDELLKTRLASSSVAADSAERMRHLAAQFVAAHADLAACRDSGAPAVAVLRGETRSDLERLAFDAEACRTNLSSLQRWVKEVALPTCGAKETTSEQSSR